MTEASLFGVYLKQLRKQAGPGGTFQKELTDALDCTDQAISDWECGRYLPSEKKVAKLCKALRLSEDEVGELIRRYLTDQDRAWVRRFRSKALVQRLKPRWERSPRTLTPLYRSTDTTDPLHVVTEDAFWRGEYVESLPKLGMHTFAFYMPDNSMTPRYNKDDLIICNIMVKLHEGKPAPVVACIRDRVYCRLLSHRASHLLFRGANRKVKPLIVSKDEVSWLYGVAMRITRENYWVKLE